MEFVDLVTFLASFLIWFMLLGLFIIWLVDGQVKKEIVVHTLMAVLCSWLITQFLKSLIPLERPYLMSGQPSLTLTVPNGNSFPSSHSAVAFALAASLFYHHRRLGFFYLFLAGLVGLSRVIANAHYLADVIFGAFLGIFVSGSLRKVHFIKVFKATRKRA